MVEHNYKINGSGKTVSAAESAIRKQGEGLVKKFKDAGCSPNLHVVKQDFKGTYELKGECRNSACQTSVTIKSNENFEAIEKKAQQKLDSVKAYDTMFSTSQYLKLFQTQMDALQPKSHRPPAEGDLERTGTVSYLTQFR